MSTTLLRHDLWNIGIINRPISSLLTLSGEPIIRWLPQPESSKYLADPFAIFRDQTVYIFCEEFNYRTLKGRIVYVRLDGDASCSPPRPALELPVHMSYPYLIEHGGEVYCVPEIHEAREIAIYRAEAFPLGWIKITTLVNNFAGVDPTVFQYGGKWWLVCTSFDEGQCRKLYIWYSPDLLGPWEPHAANPVKSDIGSSRPAGTPFMHDGALFRPAQDCSRTYGERVMLNRVTTLTTTEFVEELVGVVGPFTESSYPNAVHTVSRVRDLTIIDGKRFRFDRNALKQNLKRSVLHRIGQ